MLRILPKSLPVPSSATITIRSSTSPIPIRIKRRGARLNREAKADKATLISRFADGRYCSRWIMRPRLTRNCRRERRSSARDLEDAPDCGMIRLYFAQNWRHPHEFIYPLRPAGGIAVEKPARRFESGIRDV